MLHKLFILLSFSFSIGILSQTETGKASFYADKFDGRVTASGAIFKQNKLTAAHRNLAFGTKVKVTNLDNKKTVEVTINDRGPYTNERIIDLSKSAARKLDYIKQGVAKVKIEVLKATKKIEDKGFEIIEEEVNVKAPTKIINKEVPKKVEKSKSDVTKKEEKVKTTQKTTPKQITKITQTQKKINTISKNANITYYENYDVAKKIVTPKGFGVQIASHQEEYMLIERCTETKKNTTKKIIVQVAEFNGKKTYRIILASFPTREKATEFKEKIKTKYEGSFIITF